MADGMLAITVTPAFCLDPCTVTVNVSVQPDEMHRELMVEADSFSFYRSSFVDLDGDNEPVQHRVVWKSVPEGLYEVRATVKRLDGKRTRVTERVRVIGQ